MKWLLFVGVLFLSACTARVEDTQILEIADRSNQWGVRWSLRRFPDFAACHDRSSPRQNDLVWRKLIWTSDYWTCFYHLMNQLRSEDNLRAWLRQFDVNLTAFPPLYSSTNESRLYFSCHRRVNKCPLNWRIINFQYFGLDLIYAMDVDYTYVDNKLSKLRIGYSIK